MCVHEFGCTHENVDLSMMSVAFRDLPGVVQISVVLLQHPFHTQFQIRKAHCTSI